MNFDPVILIHLSGVLNSIELSEEHLARYDVLADYIRAHGGSMKNASRATGVPVTYQALTIVLASCLYNWFDKGLDGALALPEPETFDIDIVKDDAADREIVKCVAHATRCLAWADIGRDDQNLHQAGKTLFTLVQGLLNAPEDRMDLAISLSLDSREILNNFGDPDAKIAQLYAYRMLVHPKRLPFLPDLPPMKFPPPMPSELEESLLLNLCLDFIRQGVLDQDLDLGTIARDMGEDPEFVIKNNVEVEIDGDRNAFFFEIAFGRDLINWAFNDDKWSAEIGAHGKITALLETLHKNKDLLEMFRDDDYGHVYQTIYFGFEDDPDRLKIALKIESLSRQIRCMIGLSVADVRVNNVRDHLFARRRA
jgi:hypothetical protein